MNLDLHVHTCYSDGLLEPIELIRFAEERGIDVLAITDHDTIDGYINAIESGEDFTLELIPGVEISSNYRGIDVHILAYNFEPTNSKFRDLLKTIQKGRYHRAKKILELLCDLGVKIELDEVRNVAGKNGLIGRPHIAQAMIEKGFVNSKQEAFNKYIGDNGLAYYAKPAPSPQKIIKAVRKAGGISVIAHPYILGDDKIVYDLIKSGINGLEVYYGRNNYEVTKYYEKLACKFDLIRSGGSDFHGGEFEFETYGKNNVPDFVYDEIKFEINTKQVLI